MSELDPAHAPSPDGHALAGVVGIGASAGGLEALQQFFSTLSEGVGAAYVVIQHLGQDAGGLLPDLLREVSSLPVIEVQEGLPVQADRIYVVPPRTLLTIEGGVLHTAAPDRPERLRSLIDHFLHSLAEDQGGRAVGIILSGAGTDGTLGLKAVSDAGGMTIAQESQSARYDSMPRNAALIGAADHVLLPPQMPAVILSYFRHLLQLQRGGAAERLREQIAEVLPELCEVLHRDTSHDFKHYKTTTLVRRVLRRMQVLQEQEPRCYLERLRTERREAEALFKELLIGVTAFFRDPEAFSALAQEVLPQLLKERPPGEPVRIWVPGCATGEEAYSIAMLVRETLDAPAGRPEVQIFATDIDERALQVARTGAYPQGITESLSPERLQRFFVKKDKHYHVVKEIRELCLFSVHNLISDPPFSRIDLISCRNLLIYLGPHLQKKLIPLFHYALRPGGYLFLGPAENVTAHEELFRPINAKHRIAQRKPTAIRGSALLSRSEGYRAGAPQLPAGATAEPDLPQIAQRIVLDEFAPKHAVVSDEGQILAVSGGTARYLEAPQGQFHNDIVKMARSGLRVGLRAALADAKKNRRTVVHDDLSVSTERGVQPVRVTVQPMPSLGEEQGLFLVVFQDAGAPLPRDEVKSGLSPEHADTVIEQLERELATTRADLEKTIQELEGSNEELKSSNEELLSMNEELQSANEELETSKEEIQAANEALERAHSDLENLFAATRIATLFLDDQLQIQRFTPAMAEIYNLIPGDVGRPISHITHRAQAMPPLPDLLQIADWPGAAEAPEPIEAEIETVEGRIYTRRVLPYRTHEGRLVGMVVTFTDVTALRESERAARARTKVLKQMVHFSELFVGILSHDLRNPLTAIKLSASNLSRRLTAEPELRPVGRILSAVTRMERMISQLLDFTRIRLGSGLPLQPGEADLHAVVRQYIDESSREVQVDVAGDLRGRWDRDRLGQLLSNLIGNALQHRAPDTRVQVQLDGGAADQVTIVVHNQGAIPEELLPVLFEPLQGGRHREEGGGLGLGLFICRLIAERHGGTIGVSSDPQQGTRFTVTLPRQARIEGAAERP